MKIKILRETQSFPGFQLSRNMMNWKYKLIKSSRALPANFEIKCDVHCMQIAMFYSWRTFQTESCWTFPVGISRVDKKNADVWTWLHLFFSIEKPIAPVFFLRRKNGLARMVDRSSFFRWFEQTHHTYFCSGDISLPISIEGSAKGALKVGRKCTFPFLRGSGASQRTSPSFNVTFLPYVIIVFKECYL